MACARSTAQAKGSARKPARDWHGGSFMIALVSLALSLGADGAAGCAGVSDVMSSIRVEYDSRTSAVGRMSALLFAPSSSGELKAIDAESGSVFWSFVVLVVFFVCVLFV